MRLRLWILALIPAPDTISGYGCGYHLRLMIPFLAAALFTILGNRYHLWLRLCTPSWAPDTISSSSGSRYLLQLWLHISFTAPDPLTSTGSGSRYILLLQLRIPFGSDACSGSGSGFDGVAAFMNAERLLVEHFPNSN